MLADNINVSNAVILPISNGIVLSIPVGLANKQHLDTHREHAMDASMMTEFVAITTLKANMMVILQANVNLRQLFVPIYFSRSFKESNDFFII
jgi:hypothetical protein